MKRGIATLSLIGLLAMAASTAHAGGMAPGAPGPAVKITGPALTGILVVDTHPDGATVVMPPGSGCGPSPCTEFKAKLATLWVSKGNQTASAIFRLPNAFAASLGCDLTVTNARFAFDPTKALDNALKNWMPGPTVDRLVTDLGLNVATVGSPVITSIGSAVCTADPDNPSPTVGTPGILSAVVTIQFIQQ